jgi:excisionase family DNA binding protein
METRNSPAPAPSYPDGFASIDEVADFLGCGRTTVWHLARDEKLRTVKIGALRRYRWRDVIAYGDGLETATPPGRGPNQRTDVETADA